MCRNHSKIRNNAEEEGRGERYMPVSQLIPILLVWSSLEAVANNQGWRCSKSPWKAQASFEVSFVGKLAFAGKWGKNLKYRFNPRSSSLPQLPGTEGGSRSSVILLHLDPEYCQCPGAFVPWSCAKWESTRLRTAWQILENVYPVSKPFFYRNLEFLWRTWSFMAWVAFGHQPFCREGGRIGISLAWKAASSWVGMKCLPDS